jgi:integrase
MTWVELAEKHLARREERMAHRSRWAGYKWQLLKFAREMDAVCLPGEVTNADFLDHWDSLTYWQQDNLKPELSKFIHWLILTDRINVRHNPVPMLEKKEKPFKVRGRLTLEVYKAVLDYAFEKQWFNLYIACQISFMTSLRRGDIAKMKWADIDNDVLRVTVSKSLKSRGEVKAARLMWDLNKHQDLKTLLDDAKRLMPGEYVTGGVQGAQLTRRFKLAVRAVFDGDPMVSPTFHEIRALSAHLMAESGVLKDDIQNVLAHTDAETTDIYLGGHAVEYTEIFIAPKLQ